jgi:hypothetical protein
MFFIKGILLPLVGLGPPLMMADMPDVAALMELLQAIPLTLTLYHLIQ